MEVMNSIQTLSEEPEAPSVEPEAPSVEPEAPSVEPEASSEQPKHPRSIKRPPKKSYDTRCMARITHEHSAQQFGNGRNKFYLEYRCPLPRFRDGLVCVKCLEKKSTGAQDSRTFQHGLINGPIPDGSHIFGGHWYWSHVNKWGKPEQAFIDFALEHRREARGMYDMVYDTEMESKVADPSSLKDEMPPRKKKEEVDVPIVEKPKRTRKPKATDEPAQPAVSSEKPKKRGAPRKKTEASPYQALASEQRLIHKEVTLPTHMETSMEEVDIEDYEIKYVTLSSVEIGGVMYYIDKESQKVFKKDKKVGPYVGKYDPQTDTLHTDIPDSDDEQDDE